MSEWEDWKEGHNVSEEEWNRLMRRVWFDTIADRDAASSDFGSAEMSYVCFVAETGYYYYWQGAAWAQFPSLGGAGAPPSCSFVTINAEGDLSAETLHKNITGANLHVTKAHKAEHQTGGGDEIDVTDLSGKLADEQNAGEIKGVTVDDSGIGDGKILTYKSGSGNIEYDTAGAPGAHAATHENGGDDEISVAGLSGELADNQPPKAHKDTHKSGGSDALLVTDNLDALARIEVKKGGVSIGKRRAVNITNTASVTWAISDDAGNEEVDLQATATQAGSYKLAPSYTIYKVGSTYWWMDEDGNTDSNATFHTLVNSCITAAAGGLILIKNGAYSQTGDIVIAYSGTRLLGESVEETVITQSANASIDLQGDAGRSNELWHIEIAYMTINHGDNAGGIVTSDSMPDNKKLKMVHIHHVEFKNCKSGATFANGFSIIALKNHEVCIIGPQVYLHGTHRACIEFYAGGSDGYYAGNCLVDHCELDPEEDTGYCVVINSENNGTGNGKHFDAYFIRDTHFMSFAANPTAVGVMLGAGGLMDIRGVHIVRCRNEGMAAGFRVISAAGSGECQRLEITGCPSFEATLTTMCRRCHIHDNNGITVVDQNVDANNPNYIHGNPKITLTQTAVTRAYNCPDTAGVDWEDVNADPWPDPTGGQWEPRQVKMHNAHATFAANPYRLYSYINGGWRYVVLT